jgi:hypothetical protein
MEPQGYSNRPSAEDGTDILSSGIRWVEAKLVTVRDDVHSRVAAGRSQPGAVAHGLEKVRNELRQWIYLAASHTSNRRALE